MKTIKLNNGVEMPQIGLGTFLIPKDKLSYATSVPLKWDKLNISY